MMQKPLATPWGPAQHVHYIGQGLLRVDTAGHGGYFVPGDLVHRIPEPHRRWAATWSGSEQWYEEDCCWAAVALAFPELFPGEAIEMAESLIDNYIQESAPAGWDHV